MTAVAALEERMWLRRFAEDPRGAEHSFRNLTAFVLWLVGVTFTGLEYAVSDQYVSMCRVSVRS